MEKIERTTSDITQENIDRLSELFPSVMTEVIDAEGNQQKAIDFDALRELLGDVAEGQRERYQLTWPGKREAKSLARTPCDKTMRPERERSVNWDTTENLYIEGDNLEALKLMRETYAGRIKLIYLDPPYNTGTDFIYEDDFSMTRSEYDANSGDFDEQGGRLVANLTSNGRFHSAWCSMIYSRLALARDLLDTDGVIFISMDDNEIDNLRKIATEIFGPDNFVAQLVWEKKKKGSFLSNSITNVKEYILVFAKNRAAFPGLIGEINDDAETYPCVNASNNREMRRIPAGIESKYREKNYYLPAGSEISDTTMTLVLHSDLVIKDGVLAEDLDIEGNWRYSQANMRAYAEAGQLYITRDLYLRRIVTDTRYKTMKDWLPRVGDESSNSPLDENALKNLTANGWGSNEDADDELRLLFGVQKLLDYPKPVRLILKLIASYRREDFIVMDFFSGSATTAEAVMRLNAIAGTKIKFILVQLPEACQEDSVAFRSGFKTICEIGEQRMRLAGQKIISDVDEHNMKLALGEQEHVVPDIGFRVLRIDSSNYRNTYTEPGEQTQSNIFDFVDNLKDDRTPEDLLFQVLPSFRIPYSAHIDEFEIDSVKCYNVNDGQLIACFDTEVGTNVIEKIAQERPIYAVFRDASLVDDSAAANFEELFKTYSPDTIRRVI